MRCETARQRLVDLDLMAEDRKLLTQALIHERECEDCQTTMRDFDYMRESMAVDTDTAEPSKGWDAFEAGLMSSMRSHTRRWPLMPVSLAASVLIACLGWGMYVFRNTGQPDIPAYVDNPIANSETASAISSQEIEERLQVFREVAEMFDQRVGWVLLSGTTSDLGLTNEAPELSQGVIVVRLSVLRDESLVSSADVIIVPGKEAHLTVPVNHGKRLCYVLGMTREQPNRLRLSASIEEPALSGAPAQMSTSLDLIPRQIVSAGEIATTSGRYEVNVSMTEAKATGERS